MLSSSAELPYCNVCQRVSSFKPVSSFLTFHWSRMLPRPCTVCHAHILRLPNLAGQTVIKPLCQFACCPPTFASRRVPYKEGLRGTGTTAGLAAASPAPAAAARPRRGAPSAARVRAGRGRCCGGLFWIGRLNRCAGWWEGSDAAPKGGVAASLVVASHELGQLGLRDRRAVRKI